MSYIIYNKIIRYGEIIYYILYIQIQSITNIVLKHINYILYYQFDINISSNKIFT